MITHAIRLPALRVLTLKLALGRPETIKSTPTAKSRKYWELTRHLATTIDASKVPSPTDPHLSYRFALCENAMKTTQYIYTPSTR